jgi:Flp pilus assembly protein TadG
MIARLISAAIATRPSLRGGEADEAIQQRARRLRVDCFAARAMTENGSVCCDRSRAVRLKQAFSALTLRKEGAALVEFTLIFPILIVMLLGLVEFGEAFAVSRKLTNGASTVSDLIAQVPSVSTAELGDIARVAEEIIKPYRTANLGLVITSVQADGGNATTVAWSYAHGTGATARAQGSAFALPAGLTEANSSVIVAETVYQFTPTAGMFLTGTIELSGMAYFRPRVSRSVVFED